MDKKSAKLETGKDPEFHENFREISIVFNKAKSVTVELEGKKYTGEIEDWRIGEFILFKVENVDGTLANAPLNFEGVIFNVVQLDGPPVRYETMIIQKKLPQLLLKFPEKKVKEFKRPARRFLNIETPLILKSIENSALTMDLTGMGKLADISEGGCSIYSALEMEEDDKLHFFLDVSDTNKKKMMELEGIVKRVIPEEGPLTNYGIQFSSLSEEAKKGIDSFLKRHPSNAPQEGE